MKITVSQLRRIIKEEVSRILVMEALNPDWVEPKKVWGYEPEEDPEIKNIEDFKTWLDNYVTDLDHPVRKEDNRLLRAKAATEGRRENFYTMIDGKLYLKPELYDAIDSVGYNTIDGVGVEMKELKALVPGGVVRGLPEAPSTPVPGSRKYYMDKEGLPDEYRNAMTTEGENKSKVRR